MRALFLLAVLLSAVMIFAFEVHPGLCAEDLINIQVYTKIAKGAITNISPVDSKITINAEEKGGEKKEVTFVITGETKFIRNKVSVSLADFMQGDEVIIEYYEDPKSSGPYEANSIELVVPKGTRGY